jgi:hypothetical protein
MRHVRIDYLGPLTVTVDGRPVAVPGTRLRRLLLRWPPPPARGCPQTCWSTPCGPPASPRARPTRCSRWCRGCGASSATRRWSCGPRPATGWRSHRPRRRRPVHPPGRRRPRVTGGCPRRTRGGAGALARPHCRRDDSPAATGPRAALEELHLTARRERAALLVAAGRATEALPALEELAAEDPLREDVAAVHLDALAAAGRPAEGARRLRGPPRAARRDARHRPLPRAARAPPRPAPARGPAGAPGRQPARGGHQLRGPRRRRPEAARAPGGGPGGDRGRPRGRGQDPAGDGGRRLADRRRHGPRRGRRRLAGGAGAGDRPRRGGPRSARRPRGPGRGPARRAAARPAARRCPGPAAGAPA